MRKALLIGNTPAVDLECAYVDAAPYDLIVIGSLTLGQLLCFRDERVLEALARGMPVYLYTPGLPTAQNRAMGSALATAQRELKNWGVLFTDGGRKRLITAEAARQMRQSGARPGPGAVLTPLAKEILEGSN
jgi:hypothetical protein